MDKEMREEGVYTWKVRKRRKKGENEKIGMEARGGRRDRSEQAVGGREERDGVVMGD